MLITQHKFISRRDIALTASDKDGGAHVDVKTTAEYEALDRGVWTRIGPTPTLVYGGHQLVYLRQVGFELLNSPKLLGIAA